MKFQVGSGSGNKQTSSDPNTVQIQIGSGFLTFAIIFLVALMGLAVFGVILESQEKDTQTQGETK